MKTIGPRFSRLTFAVLLFVGSIAHAGDLVFKKHVISDQTDYSAAALIDVNHDGQIVGYTAGNDMSSREIEGENPLYLPQAKIYDGSCALGPGILLSEPKALIDLPIYMSIWRDGAAVFQGETSSGQLKRSLAEIAGWLTRELAIPNGALLMTGTGIVPPDDFSLAAGDAVRIEVGELSLENIVQS